VNADELIAAYHFRNGYWRRWTRTRTWPTPTGRAAATTSTCRSAATRCPCSRAAPPSSATATSCGHSATTSPRSWATPSSYVFHFFSPCVSGLYIDACLSVVCACTYSPHVFFPAGDPSWHGSGRRAALPVLPGGQRDLVVPWHRRVPVLRQGIYALIPSSIGMQSFVFLARARFY
jgi:hypothetical protein